MKKLYVLILSFVLCGGVMNSQNKNTPAKSSPAKSNDLTESYNNSIGLRLGWEAGLAFKHFMGDNALEGILTFGWGGYGFRLTGLYEVHKPFPNADGLNWYFGGGAHVGAYRGGYYGYYGYDGHGYYDRHGHWHTGPTMTLGIDGILGLEYKFEDAPFAISLDIKPYVDIIGYSGRFGDGALSLRYVIN